MAQHAVGVPAPAGTPFTLPGGEADTLRMHDVVYDLSTSLDGYTVDADGGIDWSVPDDEVFRLAVDEVRRVGVHLLGRRLYETMVVWETASAEAGFSPEEREFARIWQELPKVVFSSTLTEVVGNTRIATDDLATEIARLKAEPGDGDIAIGGSTLAAAAADLGLIDEYRLRAYPVLLGAGLPYFAHHGARQSLELVECRRIGPVAYLRYRVAR